ncbi:MAG: energy-coupling factor ABC transporter ATP-binding protein [Vicinamibacterales bacterium]
MRPLVEVEHLSCAFDQEAAPLRDVSFAVYPGERVGIVGANGAGKTTLLWCILGLIDCGGKARIDGATTGSVARDSVGAVFQDPDDQLFMPHLLDDVALPLINRGMPAGEARETALRTLDSLGLRDAAHRPASRLSLGQRKRAAIAAALVTRPQLLVLDEPTAELDRRSVRWLVAHLGGLTVTMIAASHDLSFLSAVASRLLVLLDGRIAADGATEQVLADVALLERAGVA